MLKSKQDIKDAIQERENELNSYEDLGCYNAAWCAGCIYAMNEILANWHDLYESQQLAYTIEDAKCHLWDFFFCKVLKHDECDRLVQRAVDDGTVNRIANRFLNTYDCDVSENDQYDAIICDMFPGEGA